MIIKKGIPTLFLTHQNADADGIACLYFLREKFGGDVGLPNVPSRTGKKLANYLDMDYIVEPRLETYEQIIIVDTPDPNQLSPIDLDDRDFIVIDHHSRHHWSRDIIYKDRTSCAEIVYELVDPAKLYYKEGFALTAGILTDTSNLKRADWQTLKTLSDILYRTDVSLNEVRKMLQGSRSFSEKICRLKGAKRLNYKKVNGLLIAFSKVSSFESSISSMLLKTGADIGFTVSDRDGGKFLLSARGREEITKKGIHLGDILKEISSRYEGITGGGHPGAAVLKGDGDADDILNECVEKTVEIILERDIERSFD